MRTLIRILAATALMLLLVYMQAPLLHWLTPAEHGGVIAASLVGRALSFGAMFIVAVAATAALMALLSTMLGEPGEDLNGGCLALVAGIGGSLAAIAGLSLAAVVLTWRVEHDLLSCVVAFLVVVPAVSTVIGGDQVAEGVVEVLGGL